MLGKKKCSNCSQKKSKKNFSPEELKKKKERVCISCVEEQKGRVLIVSQSVAEKAKLKNPGSAGDNSSSSSSTSKPNNSQPLPAAKKEANNPTEEKGKVEDTQEKEHETSQTSSVSESQAQEAKISQSKKPKLSQEEPETPPENPKEELVLVDQSASKSPTEKKDDAMGDLEDDGGWGDMEIEDGMNNSGSEMVFESEADVQAAAGELEIGEDDFDDDDQWGGGDGWTLDSKDDYEEGGYDPSNEIPEATHTRAEQDATEMNLSGRFSASNNIQGTRVQLKIGIDIACLGMNHEQRLAFGVGDADKIIIALEFGKGYIRDSNAPKMEVGCGTSMGYTDHLKPFVMAWTLKNRLKQKIFAKWPFDVRKDFTPADGWDDMLDLKEKFPHARYAVLKLAREKTKNNEQASLLLMDEKKLEELEKEVADTISQITSSSSSSSSSSSGKSNNFFSSTKASISKAFDFGSSQEEGKEEAFSERIVEIAQQAKVPPKIAALAYDLEGSLEGAIELLADEMTRNQLMEGSSGAFGAGSDDSSSNNFDIQWEYEITKHNILAKIAMASVSILAESHKNCMICARKLEYIGCKPAVCNEKSCLYAYEEFGLGFDLNLEVLENPDLLDLLITFCVSSAHQNRIEICFPESVRGSGKNSDLSFMKDGTQNMELLNEVLDLIPSVKEMQELAQKKLLVNHLNSVHALLYPLLRWLITSNRAHIRILSEEERIKSIDTPHQYVFVSCPPEREAQFANLVNKAEKEKGKGKGKIKTWHGSRLGNWHSILRMGLKNFSNTKYMANAAAYGPGVYMAKDSSTSIGYCRISGADGWNKSKFGTGVCCLALCQVVNHPDLKPPSPFYVVKQESWIVTRFFFIFEGNAAVRGRGANVPAENIVLPDIGAVNST